MPLASSADRLGVVTQRFEPLARTTIRQMMAAEVRRGMRAGDNPLVVARRIRKRAQAVTLARAQTIARTEMAVAGWEQSAASYRADPVVTQWQWMTTRDTHTCPACTLLSGTLWPTANRMQSHPNCRCTMIPVVNGAPSMGTTGFASVGRMPYAAQRSLLGPSRANYLQAGGAPEALLTTRSHAVYGQTPVLTRVRDLPR